MAITGLCRGERKIYLNCLLDMDIKHYELIATAESLDGIPIPISIYPKVNNNSDTKGASSATEYVIVVPDLSIQGIAISIKRCDEGGYTRIVYNKRFHFASLKWQSRFNYRLKPQLCRKIRDFDQIAKYKKATMSFWELIRDSETNILRGTICLPYFDDSDIDISCLSETLKPVNLNMTTLGSTKTDSDYFENVSMREIQFSMRVPVHAQTLVFVINDKNHASANNFDVLSKEQYNALLAESDFIMKNAQIDEGYPKWFEQHKASIDMLAKQSESFFSYRPVFSIVVPLYKTPLTFFDEMVDSVKAQSYGRWQLVLVNASPDDSELAVSAKKAADSDSRIKLITLSENQGISENTNAGIKEAAGDFICFFDHDDTLEPNCLYEYAKAINEYPETDLLYCDEDKLMPNGVLAQPFFKPDFNIDLLRNNNYICHMLTIRRTLLDAIEPNTKEFDGAQDHNITLRAIEKTRRVTHVPRVLYHWRISETSTAANADSKPYATIAGIKAVQDHINRMGLNATVRQSRRPFTYDVQYAVPEDEPLVSVIIPTKDHIDILDTCIRSIIERTTYTNYEIVVIENNSTEQKTFDYYENDLKKYNASIRIETWQHEFNFSKLMNFGATKAQGDYLLLLNNDTEIITPNWMETMLGQCARADVGIVGCRLFYKDDTIQHAGVCVTGGVAGHLGKNLPKGNWGYFALADATQDLSAVTAACMMTKRSVFEAVSGFTEELSVAFNDIDYCLKVREQGYLVVYTPEVNLYHYESISRGAEDNDDKKIRFHKEYSYMNYRWAAYYVKGDPYMSPNVTSNEPFNQYYHL